MVPWNKLPADLQKAILTMIVIFGGTSASCRLGPPICDPPPPPATTPMLCDPPPPPPSGTPTLTATATITPTLTASPTTTPMICDPPPPPPSSTPMLCDPPPPPSSNAAPGQSGHRAPAAMLHAGEEMQDPLPLAEIRTVDIIWEEGASGLAFTAETPWPGAHYRWSVSGGSLVEESGCVVWRPPVEPGRYLLQVVADWGRTGLAVDAAVLVVEEDGSVSFG
jgi:hypothetical protein